MSLIKVTSVSPLENDGFSSFEMYMPYLSVLPHHKDFDIAKAQEEHYGYGASNWNPYAAAYGFLPPPPPVEETVFSKFSVFSP